MTTLFVRFIVIELLNFTCIDDDDDDDHDDTQMSGWKMGLHSIFTALRLAIQSRLIDDDDNKRATAILFNKCNAVFMRHRVFMRHYTIVETACQ